MSLSAKFVSLLVPSQKNASWNSKASELRPCWRPSYCFLINHWYFFQTLSEQHWQRAGDCKRVTLCRDGDEERVPCQKMCPSKCSLIYRCASASPSTRTNLSTWQTGVLANGFCWFKVKKGPHAFATQREAFVTTAFPFPWYNHRWGTSVGAPGSLQPLLTVSSSEAMKTFRCNSGDKGCKSHQSNRTSVLQWYLYLRI